MTSHTGIPRRTVVKAAAAGAAAAAVGSAAGPARAVGPKVTATANAAANSVNIYVTTSTLVMDPVTGKGSTVVTVGNAGPNPTTGNVALKVITPYYINVDEGLLDPHWSFLYKDTRPHVPSIIVRTIPAGLGVKAEVQFTVPFLLVAGGPRIPASGRATATPEIGSSDVDIDIVRNTQGFGVILASAPPAPPPGDVNLYYEFENRAIVFGTTELQPVHIWNAGTRSTQGSAEFVCYSPFYVNFDAGQLPPSATVLYTNPDPSVPEIIMVQIPPWPSRTSSGALSSYDFKLPMKAVPGGPPGVELCSGIVQPASVDPDSDLSLNVQLITVLLRS